MKKQSIINELFSNEQVIRQGKNYTEVKSQAGNMQASYLDHPDVRKALESRYKAACRKPKIKIDDGPTCTSIVLQVMSDTRQCLPGLILVVDGIKDWTIDQLRKVDTSLDDLMRGRTKKAYHNFMLKWSDLDDQQKQNRIAASRVYCQRTIIHDTLQKNADDAGKKLLKKVYRKGAYTDAYEMIPSGWIK